MAPVRADADLFGKLASERRIRRAWHCPPETQRARNADAIENFACRTISKFAARASAMADMRHAPYRPVANGSVPLLASSCKREAHRRGSLPAASDGRSRGMADRIIFCNVSSRNLRDRASTFSNSADCLPGFFKRGTAQRSAHLHI